MEHYVNIMLDGGFKAVFGDKQVAMDLPYDLPSGRDRSWLEVRAASCVWNLSVELQLARVSVVAYGRGASERAYGWDFWTNQLKQVYISFERFDLSYEECETPLEIIQSLWSDKPVADWNYSGWHGSWGEVSFLIRAIRIWSNIRLMRLTPH